MPLHFAPAVEKLISDHLRASSLCLYPLPVLANLALQPAESLNPDNYVHPRALVPTRQKRRATDILPLQLQLQKHDDRVGEPERDFSF